MKVLIILFILKLYTCISILNYIQEKYEQEMIKLARKIELQHVKIAKVKCDIRFLLYCRKNNLAPIFTRPKFAIRVSNYLRNKISRQILETEIRNQDVKKKEINLAAEREH